MREHEYLMESDEEAFRLDIKTDVKLVEEQAQWAGIKYGMRVADIGCGSGTATSVLKSIVGSGGSVVGVDNSSRRVEYARNKYSSLGVDFLLRDIKKPLESLGQFDFVWVRFLLEYYKNTSFDLVKNISGIVKPGGTLCLMDLDYNSLNYSGIPSSLERKIIEIVRILEEKENFDPYVGRKLYTFLYDLGYTDLDVRLTAHHLIFGKTRYEDEYNWMKKMEVISQRVNGLFDDYEGGFEMFRKNFSYYFKNPRRFIYTPLISARGVKNAA
jgi:SAM-dependent methyltransferase